MELVIRILTCICSILFHSVLLMLKDESRKLIMTYYEFDTKLNYDLALFSIRKLMYDQKELVRFWEKYS